MAEITSLEINLQATGADKTASDIEKVRKSLNSFANRIPKISEKLNNMNYEGLVKMTKALKDMSKVDLGGLTGIGKALGTIQRLNASKIAEKLQEVNDALDGKGTAGSSSQNSGEKAKKTGNDWKKALDKIKQGAKSALNPISKLFSSLGRIAFYRLIRSAIKLVEDAFSSGINNVYQWSKAIGGQFAQSMDRISSSANYLKNSIGAMVSPLINALAPAFEFVTEKVVAFLNALNQLFARMSGANTWTKAIKTQKEYAAAVNKSKGALAGFDELNNIGGSKASSGDTASYKFETEDIDNAAVDNLAKKLITIGTVLAGIKLLIDGIRLVSFAKSLAEISPTLAKIGTIAGGLLITIGGLALMFAGLYDAINNGITPLNTLVTVLGGIAAGIGVGIMAGLTGVQLVIAGVVGGLVGLVAVIAVAYLKYQDQVNAFVDNIQNALGNALEWIHNTITTKFGIFGFVIGQLLEGTISVTSTFIATVHTLLTGLFSGIKQIVQGIVQIFKGDLKGGIQTALNGILTIVKSIGNAIWTFVKGIINNVLRGVENAVNGIIRGFNAILSPLRNAGNWLLNKLGINGSIPSFSSVSLPRLNVGTNYVPEDQIAMIHKGEAVIPKKFNSQEYFGNNNETNDLLRQLINVVMDKDMNTYIDGNEIGKASVKYINKQSRLKGASIV